MKVPYHIVIEPQEFEEYSKVIDKEKILQLPFSNLGKGSIPARNWVWDHAQASGAERHWILDDNIRSFRRIVDGKRIRVSDGTIFKACEDFVDRYENVALAGMQYQGFGAGLRKPFALNARIYSVLLIKNDIDYRWRGKYNEDTDLSIRVLKDGWCTILFYWCLAEKLATMTIRGGNTDELYKQDQKFDGRLEMARHLVRQHPDITTIYKRWGRWQHKVDYSGFKKNKLIKKEGVVIPKGVNNYGMKVIQK